MTARVEGDAAPALDAPAQGQPTALERRDASDRVSKRMTQLESIAACVVIIGRALDGDDDLARESCSTALTGLGWVMEDILEAVEEDRFLAEGGDRP